MAGLLGFFFRSEVVVSAVLGVFGVLCATFLSPLPALTVIGCLTPFIVVAYTAGMKDLRNLTHFGVRLTVSVVPQFLGAFIVTFSSVFLLALIVNASFSAALATATSALIRILKKEFAVFLSLTVCILLLSSVFVLDYVPLRNYTLVQIAIDINPFCAVFYGAANYDWLHSPSMYDRIGSFYPFRHPTISRTSLIYTVVALLFLFVAFFRYRNLQTSVE
ncbi:MAG: hypothetical protein N2234_09560 [Planctomycetota bacterium]|nr:hypothetical protein [Planctomycetota bacterium]